MQDAVAAVRLNPVVERGDLVEIFSQDYWADTVSPAHTLYRPVTVLSFALERAATGEPSAMLSHAVNIGLHELTAFLFFLYCRRIGAHGATAAAAALLFTVHPLLLQAVVNVVGRADLLATLFSLGALFALTASRARPRSKAGSGRQRIAAWSAAALLFLALGSKEVALATPLLLVAQELVLRDPRDGSGAGWWIDRAAALAPSALAAVVFLMLRTRAIEAFPGYQAVSPLDNVLVGLEGLPRLATALSMATRYVALMVFPVGLSADYSGHVIARQDTVLAGAPLAGLAILGLLLALAGSRWLVRRSALDGSHRLQPLLAMGSLLMLLPYLVIGNVLVLNAAGFAERLVYFSTSGFVLLAAVTLEALPARWTRNRRPAWVVIAVLLVLGTFQTRREARMWEGLESLYVHALRSAPPALLAHFGLAELRREQDRFAEAERLFEDGLAFSPDSAELWEGLGRLLRERGDLARAEPALVRAIEVDPELPRAHLQLGLVLSRTGRRDEAERALLRALRLNPRLDRAGEELAEIYMISGRYREAAQFFRGCIALGRSDLLPRLRRAEALAAVR